MNPAVLVPIVVIVVLVVALALYLWVSYHSLTALGRRVDEGWADIEAQLQRRAELVPVVVQAVQQYATHERGVFDAAGRARDETLSARTPGAASTAETHLQRSLQSLHSVAETYPPLHASPAYLGLQSELGTTQNDLQTSRRFYNGAVREFNAKIQVFPNGLFARRLGLTSREYFDAADGPAVAEPPRVQF